MIYLIIASLLLPLILILLYLSYYNIRILRGLYIAKKFDYVSSVDYETIPLIPIRTNINFPSSEHGLLIFDVTNIYQEQSQKMYTGSTIGGINVPFATLGYTKRRFYQKKDFLKYGETNIVVSNIHIHLSGYDYPNKAKLIIREIESLSFCDYGSTVLIRNEYNLTYKIKFKTLSEALYFVNSI